MPYINSQDGRRQALRNGEPAKSAGELNYQIFYHIKHFEENFKGLNNHAKYAIIYNFVSQFLGDNPNYQRYNDMTGCLTLCAKEIKRRLKIDIKKLFEEIVDGYDDEIAKYEDIKITQNGDVE